MLIEPIWITWAVAMESRSIVNEAEAAGMLAVPVASAVGATPPLQFAPFVQRPEALSW